MIALDPICFMFNSIAMGDIVAAVPVVKYMVENFYQDHKNYYVCVKPQFRVLFPFVPDENILDFDKKDNMWGIPESYPIATLNKKKEARLTRLTPKHIHLSQFASLQLTDRLIDKSDLNYVELPPVDVSKFELDFYRAVVLVTSYRDVTRMWKAEYLLEFADWLKNKGFMPVFIGRTDIDTDLNDNLKPKTSLPENISDYGVDLRNETSIEELATIMGKSRAVCGIDSGPIHLAGTTATPIICGYTSVSSEYRIPIRKHGITIPIEPKIECIGCESKWHSTYWNFENCYHKHADCVNMMTADKFISAFQQIIKI